MNSVEEVFWADLAQIQAESIGWIHLDEGAYLHVGSDESVIQVMGLPRLRWLVVMCCGWSRVATIPNVTRCRISGL
jgi:hypothetical protein